MNYKKSKSYRQQPTTNGITKMPIQSYKGKIESIYYSTLNSIGSKYNFIIQRKAGSNVSNTFSQPDISKAILQEKANNKCNTYSKIVRVILNSKSYSDKNQKNINYLKQDPFKERSKSLKMYKIKNRPNNTDINNLEKSNNLNRKKSSIKITKNIYNTADNTDYNNSGNQAEEINTKRDFIYVNRKKRNSIFNLGKIIKKNNSRIYEGFRYDLPLQCSSKNNINADKNDIYNKKLVKSSSDKHYSIKNSNINESNRDNEKKNNFCISSINNDKDGINSYKLEFTDGIHGSIGINNIKSLTVSSRRKSKQCIKYKVTQSKKLFEEVLSKEKKIKHYFITNKLNINDRELYEQSAISIQSTFRGYSMRIKLYQKLNDYINIRNFIQVIKRFFLTKKSKFLKNFKEFAKMMPKKDKNDDNKIISKNMSQIPIDEIKIVKNNYFLIQKIETFNILSAKKEMNKKLTLLNKLLKDKNNLQRKLDKILNENRKLKEVQKNYEELKKKYEEIEKEKKAMEDINDDYIQNNSSLNNQLNHTNEQLKQYKFKNNTNGKIINAILKKVYLKYLILNRKSQNQILLRIAFNKYKLIIRNNDNEKKKGDKKGIVIDNGYIIEKEEEASKKIRNKKLKDLIRNKFMQNKEFMHSMFSKFYYQGLLFTLKTKGNNYTGIILQDNTIIKNGQGISRENLNNNEIENTSQNIKNSHKFKCFRRLLFKKQREIKDILKCYYSKFYYNGIIFSLQNNKIYDEIEELKEIPTINGIENKSIIPNNELYDKKKIILKKTVFQKDKKTNIILKNSFEKWNIKAKIISMLELTRNSEEQKKSKRKKPKKKKETSKREYGIEKKSNKDNTEEKNSTKNKKNK